MTTTAPAKARLQLPVSGPTLAMVCWSLGPFWLVWLHLLLVSGVVGENSGVYDFLSCDLGHVAGLLPVGLAIFDAPFRRCLEGRCVLFFWVVFLGALLFALVRYWWGWQPPDWPLLQRMGYPLQCGFLAALWLPPLRYTIRCRVASGRPGRLVTIWLPLASCTAIWLGWLLFDGASDFAPEAQLRLALPFPWLLHGIAILLLALGTVHWTLVRSAIGLADVGYWLSLLLLTNGAPSSPTTDTALLSAMAVLGLFVPLAALPRWFRSSR